MHHQEITARSRSASYSQNAFPDRILVWAVWLLPLGLSFLTRPLYPVDETRYLAVAWNMWRDTDFIVPHLNGVFYGHKPPLLFWLIHLCWSIFGVNEWCARLIQPLFAIGSLFLLRGLAARLWPDRPSAAVMAPMLFAGGWYTLLYIPGVMFDLPVVFFVLLAFHGLLGDRPRWPTVGAALALGLLTKGPVILVYTLPALLGAPFWRARPAGGWRRWYIPAGLAFTAALLPVFVWLWLAWHTAGDAFLAEVLWNQTAERLSGEIGHGRPLWWYLPLLPILLLPWSVWPPFWRALRPPFRDRGVRLCLGASLAALLILSLVGGKQPHYLLPLLALTGLGVARLLADATQIRRRDQAGVAGVFLLLALALASVVAGWWDGRIPEWSKTISFGWPALLAMTALLLLRFHPSSLRQGVTVLFIASSLLGLSITGGVQPASRPAYDMTRIGQYLARAQASGRAVAYLGNYQGEFDFPGRLREPVTELNAASVPDWLAAHPRGLLVTRDKRISGNRLPAAVYQQAFRSGRLFVYPGRGLQNSDAEFQDE